MKLALIRRQFSATGGAELYVQRLLGALAQQGHELHLFAEAWKEKPDGVTLHPIPVAGSRAQKPVRFAHAVQAELAKEKFDCVFSLERTLKQDVYRAGDGVHRVWLQRRREFAAWWKKPFIGLGAFHRNMRALEARTFDPANTRHVIVNSDMVKREILEHFKFPAERIHLVRNGVDVARFQSGKRAETRARFGVKEDGFLLLFVGSGWERKGLAYVTRALLRMNLMFAKTAIQAGIEATRKVFTGDQGALPMESPVPFQHARLLVVGKGKPFGRLGNAVIYAETMSDVENAYAAADLLVFPPIYEPSSNVVAEALAAGLPVITSMQNGAAELIEEQQNGSVLNDPSDIAAMVDAVRFWMAHRPRKVVVSEYELSLERNVMETVNILEQAATERQP